MFGKMPNEARKMRALPKTRRSNPSTLRRFNASRKYSNDLLFQCVVAQKCSRQDAANRSPRRPLASRAFV
jgi:hypothetical protein